MGLVGVVITFKSGHLIGGCLRALLADGLGVDQILVWDNASGDDSAAVAETILGVASVIRSEENIGFAAAVNRAAESRPEDDLLLVNPDAVIRPGTVAALTRALHDPEVAVVGSRLEDLDGHRQPDCWRYPAPRLAILGAMLGLGRAYRPRRKEVGEVEYVDGAFVPFTAALVRRATFDALGGLDEEFWLYGEDSEYCYRAFRAGHRIAVAVSAGARHVSGASSAEVARMKLQLKAGDRFRTKHFGDKSARTAARALRRGARLRLAVGGLAFGQGPHRFAEWRQVLDHYSGT